MPNPHAHLMMTHGRHGCNFDFVDIFPGGRWVDETDDKISGSRGFVCLQEPVLLDMDTAGSLRSSTFYIHLLLSI